MFPSRYAGAASVFIVPPSLQGSSGVP
jgi:hypothetical protein